MFEGFLGLSIYGYAQKGLGWSPKKSIATALLGTLYFVALRVSMDSLRNMLGLVFFFVVLTLFSLGERKGYSWKTLWFAFFVDGGSGFVSSTCVRHHVWCICIHYRL